MSWIALACQGKSWVCPGVFGAGAAPRGAVMSRGSILIEARLVSGGLPQTLLSYEPSQPWAGSISLQTLPGGFVDLTLTQGDDVFRTVLKDHAEAEIVRITYSWDRETGFGQFAVERSESETVGVAVTAAPPRLLFDDMSALARHPQMNGIGSNVIFFAVSDRIETVGPVPSLGAQVPVLTPTGYRPVAALQCGDTVKTSQSGVVPVLHRVSRVVPALGSFQPVRLRAPYFGLMRDIVVAPHQRLLIGGADVEYIFGREAVLVPALSLVNGIAAVYEDGLKTVEYHQLVLPDHEPVIAAGAELESLYVGRLRRQADQLNRTVLAQVPRNLMPEHVRRGLKVLGPFEAITLIEARAA